MKSKRLCRYLIHSKCCQGYNPYPKQCKKDKNTEEYCHLFKHRWDYEQEISKVMVEEKVK